VTGSQRQVVDHRLGRARDALAEARLLADDRRGNASVKPGVVSRELGATYNDLFENRQKSDYMDFVQFDGDQVRTWIAQAGVFVEKIANLVAAEAADSSPEDER